MRQAFDINNPQDEYEKLMKEYIFALNDTTFAFAKMNLQKHHDYSFMDAITLTLWGSLGFVKTVIERQIHNMKKKDQAKIFLNDFQEAINDYLQELNEQIEQKEG